LLDLNGKFGRELKEQLHGSPIQSKKRRRTAFYNVPQAKKRATNQTSDSVSVFLNIYLIIIGRTIGGREARSRVDHEGES
jgi:hypothetical protein